MRNQLRRRLASGAGEAGDEGAAPDGRGSLSKEFQECLCQIGESDHQADKYFHCVFPIIIVEIEFMY